MYFSVRSSIGLLILISIAAATWLANRHEAAPRAVQSNRQAPLGYYLRDAVFFGTNEQGRIFYRVHAGLAEQRPDQDGLKLSDVTVDYRDTEHVQWQLTAEHASSMDGDPDLDLDGNVRLTSSPDDGMPGTVIEADALRLEPNHFIAQSESPVRISVGKAVLTGTGLTAHLKDDRLELESKVHGQFSP